MAGYPIQERKRPHFLARHALMCVALLVAPHDVSDGHALAEVIKPELALSIAWVGPHRGHDATRPNACSSPRELRPPANSISACGELALCLLKCVTTLPWVSTARDLLEPRPRSGSPRCLWLIAETIDQGVGRLTVPRQSAMVVRGLQDHNSAPVLGTSMSDLFK